MSDKMEGAEGTDEKQKENDGKRGSFKNRKMAKESQDQSNKMDLEKTAAISNLRSLILNPPTNGHKTENDEPNTEENVEDENSYVDIRDQLSKLITDNMDSDRSLTPEIDETKGENDLDLPEDKKKIDSLKDEIKTQFGEVDLW